MRIFESKYGENESIKRIIQSGSFVGVSSVTKGFDSAFEAGKVRNEGGNNAVI